MDLMKICSKIPPNVAKMTEVNIRWVFNIAKWDPTRNDIALCSTYIQQEEKERLGRFVFRNDFKASLVGRLLMRKFLSQTTNIPYNELILSRDNKGKPILINPNTQEIQFNVSHQGDFVVLAGSNGNTLLGIDVMKMEYKGGKKLSEFFRIMNKQFSNYEWETIKRGSERDQVCMFYRHWCLKESYVKAVGVGITVNLQNISFKVVSKNLTASEIVNDTKLYLHGQKQDWEFHERLLDEDHCVAVAMNSTNNKKFMFKEICFKDLVQSGVSILDEDSEYCDSYFKKMEKHDFH